jgi:hypothetical protein
MVVWKFILAPDNIGVVTSTLPPSIAALLPQDVLISGECIYVTGEHRERHAVCLDVSLFVDGGCRYKLSVSSLPFTVFLFDVPGRTNETKVNVSEEYMDKLDSDIYMYVKYRAGSLLISITD